MRKHFRREMGILREAKASSDLHKLGKTVQNDEKCTIDRLIEDAYRFNNFFINKLEYKKVNNHH